MWLQVKLPLMDLKDILWWLSTRLELTSNQLAPLAIRLRPTGNSSIALVRLSAKNPKYSITSVQFKSSWCHFQHGKFQAGITHTSNDLKKSVDVVWTPPADYVGPIIIQQVPYYSYSRIHVTECFSKLIWRMHVTGHLSCKSGTFSGFVKLPITSTSFL